MSPFVPVALAMALTLSSCGGGGGGGDTATPAPAEFLPMGLLPTFVSSTAQAVSGDGTTVAGTMTDLNGRSEAFVWRPPQRKVLLGSLPGGTHSAPTAISGDGSIVTGYGNTATSPSTAFRFSAATGMLAVDALPGATVCSASAISDSGSAIAGTCLLAGNAGYRWTAATGAVNLGRFGTGTSGASTATALSRNGAVVGGQGHPFLTGAMLWDANAVPRFLGKVLPDDQSAIVTALSGDGSVAVGSSVDAAGKSWMFRWTDGAGMQRIAQAAGMADTYPQAISADGAIVVGRVTGPGSRAFIWDAAHGIRLLADVLASDYGMTLTGWTLESASSVSANGRVIAGTGTNPQGGGEGWMVTLP
jgi:probable HAF family extracellular repeat protein